jgi:ABC-type phosphate transport system substrate-binding protein
MFMDSQLGSIQSTGKRAALAQAVMIAMGVVTSIDASASTTTIFGGGATLPAAAYEGATDADSTARLKTTLKATSGSLFQLYLENNSGVASIVSYCQTGSGTGRKVLDQTLLADGACPAFTATPSGFGAPTGILKPDFAASDAPLAQSDVNAVIAISGATQPVQVPTVAASIAIAFNSVHGLSGTPSITDALLCSIFSGAVTNWSKVSSELSGNITVVYRSDGSGTTFSFANHLSNVCSRPNASTYFTTDPSGLYTNVIAHAGAGGTLPKYAGAVAASGNPGVVTALGTTASGIAYVETKDAIDRTGGALAYFKVQPKGGTTYYDPLNDFAPSGKLSISTTTNAVVSGVNSVGIAVLSAATGTTEGKCLIVTNPATYDNFTTEYPIVGVSNLLAYYSDNAHKAAVSALLQQGAVQPAHVNTIGASTGFAYLTDAGGHITTTIINSCIN